MARGAQRRKSALEGAAEISKIDARPHLEGRAPPTQSAISAIAQATVPMWVQTAAMIGLIFGGCCSNVSKNPLDCKKSHPVLETSRGARVVRQGRQGGGGRGSSLCVLSQSLRQSRDERYLRSKL